MAAQEGEFVGESPNGFKEAAEAAAKKLDANNKGKGPHKLKVRLEVDVTVDSPGSIGTYRVVLS